MKIAYYSSTDPSPDYIGPIHNGEVRDGEGNIIQRGTANVERPDGAGTISYLWEPLPADRYYEVTEDTTPQPQYHTFVRDDYAFSGTEFDPAARVVQARVYAQISLDALLEAKMQELSRHVEFIAGQSVRSTGNNNFWISLAESERRRRGNASDFLSDRTKDRTLGKDSSQGHNPSAPGEEPTTYWKRDIRVLLIRDSNGNRLRSPVDEAAWGQVLKDQGQYDEDSGDAEDAVTNAITTAYDAGDWAALAAIDVTDAATYGWPDYYTGPVSALIRRTNQRNL